MDNQIIFAAAGYGKTYSLCYEAKQLAKKTDQYILLISYTNEGIRSLENEYKKQNCGVLDDKVIIKSWYSVLLSEFIKPYQCLLKLKNKTYSNETNFVVPENYVNSIAFYDNSPSSRIYTAEHKGYFINKNGDIIPDRTSHLAYLCNRDSYGKAIMRMKEIYAHIFIDELQDYAGWDLEIIKILLESQISVKCVGDYRQTTYMTNNSQKNSQYRGSEIVNYFKNLEKKEICTISYANTTRRFNQDICDFVNTIYRSEESLIKPNPSQDEILVENSGVYIIEEKYLSEYCGYYNPTILRYNKKSKINFENNSVVFNYGSSKGATYERIVIIPVRTVVSFIEKQNPISADQTKAKFYVACTRAKYSVVFAMDKINDNKIFNAIELHFGNKVIPAYKFNRELAQIEMGNGK